MLKEIKDILSSSSNYRDTALCQIIEIFLNKPSNENFTTPFTQILIEIINKIHPKDDRILNLRKTQWENNFGVPPLEFQLRYSTLITDFIAKCDSLKSSENWLETLVTKLEKGCDYQKNDEIYSEYELPPVDASGSFIPTLNKQGYMTTRAVDFFSKQFIERAEKTKNENGRVLEIGAAYGVATLSALEKGATVVCNDLEPSHLAVVVKAHKKMNKGNLIPVAGSFPEELAFKENEFDAILISRVLHFFDGEELVLALNKARKWLKVGGSLFVINETPYLANWKDFLEEYKTRKEQGEKWPGLITDTKKYEKNRSFSLPPLVHWLDEDTLRVALKEAGFSEDEIKISYINRQGQFPPDMLMDSEQKESVGCNAIKLG